MAEQPLPGLGGPAWGTGGRAHREIEAVHRDKMNDVAGLIQAHFMGYGFALLVFPFGTEPGRMNYISNAPREGMIVAMEAFVAKNKGMV